MAMTEKNIFTKEAIKEYITNRKSDLKLLLHTRKNIIIIQYLNC